MSDLPHSGHDRLWLYFGLSYATWLTLPRVLCHEMPDDWQGRLAQLMDEWEEHWQNMPDDMGTRVLVTSGGKLTKTPRWLLNYRHPDRKRIERLRAPDRSQSS